MSRFNTMGIQQEVVLSQGIIRYREIGTGEPLLFLHGLLVNGDLWRKVVPTLAKSFRCIVPDLPLGGHEFAFKPATDLTPPGLARIVSDFIEALALRNVTLVASDTGGAIAQLVITQYPRHIVRLVLTDCDAFENFPPPVLRPFQWAGYFTPILIQFLKLDKLQKRPLIMRLVAKKPVEREAVQSYLQSVLGNREIERDLGKVLRGISNRYTKAAAAKLSSFNKPVLIVWANQDFLFPVKDAQRLVRAFSDARLEYVNDSFAFISEDQPARLTELIEAFIAETALAISSVVAE